jgi:hypothetical protein
MMGLRALRGLDIVTSIVLGGKGEGLLPPLIASGCDGDLD